MVFIFFRWNVTESWIPVKFYGMSDDEVQQKLLDAQRRDKIKNDYCSKNNIPLLRIPYWEKKNMKKIITEYLLNFRRVSCLTALLFLME